MTSKRLDMLLLEYVTKYLISLSPKLIDLKFAVNLIASGKLSVLTGISSTWSIFLILEIRSLSLKFIFDGLVDELKIILQFEVKQLFIKLNKAISHSSSEDIKSTSSMQMSFNWSKESIRSGPCFLTSVSYTHLTLPTISGV